MTRYSKFLFLVLFMPICLSAQISLMLEDETKTGFKLVIDGYLQNEKSVNKLNLQKLALGEHELIFLMSNGKKLKRKIDLDKSSNYQYVLHDNFMGERKLRFRGSKTSLTQSAMVLDFNDKVEYQEITDLIAVADSLPANNKAIEEEVKEPIALKDSVAAPVAVLSSLPDPDTITASIATVTAVPEGIDSIEPTSPIDIAQRQANGFSALQKSIKLNDFEFDKIQMIEEFLNAEKINPNQLVSLLKELKYDQSRLQILKSAALNQADLKEDKALFLATLDYELSRLKAETFFNENK